MSRLVRFVALAAVLQAAAAMPAVAQTAADDARFEAAQRRFQNELQVFQDEFARYQAARTNAPHSRPSAQYAPDDRYENGYDAARYYRDGSGYQERALAPGDRVYRGSDGRYYCKRSDGTTGLIIGAVGGGILGNVIDGGHSRVAGTLLGGALGAVVGKAVDQKNSEIRCR